MSKQFTYGRIEKLKSRKQLASLFKSKQSFLVFPLKIFYQTPLQKINHPVKTGVGTNSRMFKKAVHRNRIKRVLREAYRLNKQPLLHYLTDNNKQVILFILYIDKALPEANILQLKMPLAIRQLIKKLDEETARHT